MGLSSFRINRHKTSARLYKLRMHSHKIILLSLDREKSKAVLRRRDFIYVEVGILRKAGKSEEETKQDMKWSGVKENLMVISNPPRGRNTAISFGMKGMS